MGPTVGTALLEVSDVSVRFGGIAAISQASLTLAPGEVCGLIGPNGAGKTTLFDVISGIRNPQGGRVVFDGNDITSWNPIRRSRAGMHRTFQVVQMFGWLSVLDNVTAALDWEGGGGGFLADLVAFPTRTIRNRDRRERARAALEACGLSAMADQPAGSLPIGLARMVELARATVDNPKVLLLDEPTSGLDATEAHRLADQIAAISSENNCGVLLVEHDMDFLMRQCHRVVVLNLGEVLAVGTPEEVRADPAVRAAYLGG
ncbi:MAG: ABC transporter ATP-binding protein [Acidimicrobiales bacterium]|jgi:branched-chain amino acid transport system ATP-binding protein